MNYVLLISLLLSAAAASANQACPNNVPNHASRTCWYFSAANGNDSTLDGTQETVSGAHGPLAHAPGMPGCTGNCSTLSLTSTSAEIFRGEVFPTSGYLPWQEVSGIAYIGYDPAWNDGTVKSIKPTSSGQNCTAISVSLSGGGGTSAAGTANFLTSSIPSWAGNLQHVTLTNAGSGYTSNPSVSFAGSTCTTLPTAVADVLSPVFDGSGTAWTAANLFSSQYMIYVGDQNIYVDHLDVRSMMLSNATLNSCNAVTMLGIEGGNVTANNIYVHKFGTASYPQSGTTQPCNNSQGLGMAGPGNGTNGTIQNSWADNYEATVTGPCGWTGTNTSGAASPYCGQSIGIFGATTVTNTMIHDLRGGLYDGIGQSQSFTGLNIWNIYYDIGSQHGDGIYLHNGGVFADNIIHDTEGASNYLFEFCSGANCNTPNTMYVFNNVFWNQTSVSQGFFNVAGEFVTGTTAWSTNPTLYFWNNTGNCDGAGGGSCIGVGQYFGGANALWAQTTFNLYNNHAISNQGSGHWYSAPASGTCSTTNGCGTWNGLTQPQSGTTQAAIDASNVVMSTATAASQGYTAANSYAPTASNNSTVTFSGTNFTSTTPGCGTSGLSLLCSDILGTVRPTVAAWQAGAYQFGTPQATAPTCSPTSGSSTAPIVVTCTNQNSGTTIMCYTLNGSTPITNTIGTGCTVGTILAGASNNFTISITTSILNIVAGTSTLADSSLVTYGSYTITTPTTQAPAVTMMSQLIH